MAALVGSAVALFLWLLGQATALRLAQPWLLWLLPLAGVGIVLAYQQWGGKSDQGNNLVLEEIHQPGQGVPLRLTPFVMLATVVTHLFGGSAGREGTAIQMGGSLSSQAARRLGLKDADARLLIMAGMAAGFGAVFGSPLAGTVFALEVLSIGAVRYDALLPCLAAAVTADRVCRAWGIHHTDYHVGMFAPGAAGPDFAWALLAKVAVAAVAFGLAALLFAELNHGLSTLLKRRVARPWLRPVLGALAVIALAYALGTRDYLGLGVDASRPGGVSILSCFQPGGATAFSWLWKTLFTAITLSAGFKGGEVTPLFFVGAALGNALAVALNAPVDLFAALGFVAVFGAATNTPLACTLMGVELFGGAQALPMAMACFIAYACSGHNGVYLSQRLGAGKGGLDPWGQGRTLRELRDERQRLWDL
jgi:H+/Cl- antiporter ClcA